MAAVPPLRVHLRLKHVRYLHGREPPRAKEARRRAQGPSAQVEGERPQGAQVEGERAAVEREHWKGGSAQLSSARAFQASFPFQQVGIAILPISKRARSQRWLPRRARSACVASTSQTPDCAAPDFCFLKKLSGVRKLTTFYLAKNDHRWVIFISLKTISSRPEVEHLRGDFSAVSSAFGCVLFQIVHRCAALVVPSARLLGLENATKMRQRRLAPSAGSGAAKVDLSGVLAENIEDLAAMCPSFS